MKSEVNKPRCWNRGDELRCWFEHTFVIAGFDPIYGVVYKQWFIWYAWSIGVKSPPPSEHRIEPTMSISAAIWSNIWGNLRDYASRLRRGDFGLYKAIKRRGND